MLEMLRQKMAELEAGLQQLQRDRKQLDGTIAMQQGAMAFCREMIAELEQAETVARETPPAVEESVPTPAE